MIGFRVWRVSSPRICRSGVRQGELVPTGVWTLTSAGFSTPGRAFPLSSGRPNCFGKRANRNRFARLRGLVELLYFSDCILNDREPEPSGEEGLQDVRIVQALYQSAKAGKPIAIRPFTKTIRPTGRQRIDSAGSREAGTRQGPERQSGLIHPVEHRNDKSSASLPGDFETQSPRVVTRRQMARVDSFESSSWRAGQPASRRIHRVVSPTHVDARMTSR